MPNKVFISYRREDSRYQAHRIYDAFVQALPLDSVFMDVDSIAPGADFVEILEGWVQQCDVLLALIGPRWIDSIDPRTNLRRLDNPEDFVRIEVRGALERKIPVVPVLLDAAGMPTAAELPDDIKALRRRNAEFVDFRTFDADVQRLIKRLKLGKKTELPSEAAGPQAGNSGSRGTSAAVSPFVERIKHAMTAKPVLLAAASLLLLLLFLAAASIGSIMRDGTRTDVSVRATDFAKSEEGRRTAESRASQAVDALAISEKARQEAETKAAVAVAALTKTEEDRRAAEARANDATDAAKKSDKARLDAEARATSAAAGQTKAEDGQRAAEKARVAAEGAASGAAIARSQADSGRQAAEARANDAAEALKKSEKARQEAEAKLAALLPAAAQQTAGSPSLSSGQLLNTIGSKSRWAIDGNCNSPKAVSTFSLGSGGASITWADGFGGLDTEKVLVSYENTFYTTSDKKGHSRAYSRNGDRISVQPIGGGAFMLIRCP
jgi:hypothetical protein